MSSPYVSKQTGALWVPVIGLEVHAQLKTRTKLFCGCANTFGEEPNTAVCPLCTAQPGALPVLNAEALELAVRAAFTCVMAGKQVAVLVPTTVLAEQHGHVFAERFASYPINVSVLSRFRTAKEQREILAVGLLALALFVLLSLIPVSVLGERGGEWFPAGNAMGRLGGTVRVIVLDNLLEGVLKPDVYDPTLNPLYRDVLGHYGVVALPCRVRDPDRKGKVEAGVGHAQKTPLRGMRFETIEQAQAYLDRWEERWADTRIHGTTKRQVAAMFAEEQPALGPLPLEPFRYYRYGERTVHLDGCVEVEAAYYGAPPGWIGRRIQVQWNSLHVRLLAPKTGLLLREHIRAPRGWHRIRDDDQPARTPRSTLAQLQRARTAGPHIHTLCESIHQSDGVKAIRRILGVLSLAKKHGPAVVDEAAKAALEIGAPTYRFLRRYLERQPAAPLTLRQVDPLIRQLTLYRDLIDRKTGDLQ